MAESTSDRSHRCLVTSSSASLSAKRCLGSLVKLFDFEKKELHATKLKELKNIIRNNASIIREFVHDLFKVVRQENSDRRLAILLICDQFFYRSHTFRVELTEHLQDFLVHTAETDPLHYPLPHPKEAAVALKIETLKSIKLWYEKFATAYPKLTHVYEFLRTSKAFDFENVDAQLQVERQRTEEAERRKNETAAKIIAEIERQLKENEEDMRKCLNETRSAIEILVPRFDADSDNMMLTSPSTGNNSKALHGYDGIEKITVVVPMDAPIFKTNEIGEALISSIIDCMKILSYYKKLLLKWQKTLTKFGATNSQELLGKLLDLKADVSLELERCEELKIPQTIKRTKHDSDSDSDEFIDVPNKEGLELDFKQPDDDIPPHVWQKIASDDPVSDSPGPSTSFQSNVGAVIPKDSQHAIPVLSFGLDLQYWGNSDVVPAEIPRNNSDCHRFWRAPDEDDCTSSDQKEVYRERLMTFIGHESKEIRKCGAPMKDGLLCPRTDRGRCPLHGNIVDRDEMGFPTEPQSENLVKEEVKCNKEDEEFLKDIEMSTGVALSDVHSKKNKRISFKKREISESQKVRQRLSTKLFDRRTLKRVSETLDAIRKARASKNFEHQFNYALKRT